MPSPNKLQRWTDLLAALLRFVGLRRQRLFAAQPEVAERLLGLSRLAELATAWARRATPGRSARCARSRGGA